MTIAASNLPRASVVDQDDGLVRHQSDYRSGGILHTRTPDPEVVPVVWRLHYIAVRPEVIAALRAHWRQHRLGDFDWTPPGASAAVRVTYLEAPSISWDSASSGNATVRLEAALAHD